MKMFAFALGLAVVLILGGPLTSRASDANPSVEPLDVAVLEEKASQGDVDAKYQLGRALFRGEGVGQDIPRAAGLIREAAEAGDPRAMDGLGFLYLTGKGFDADETKALEWFEKGAKAGYPKAQVNAGLLWRQAKTIERSNENGLTWLNKAAEGGSLEANEILGRLYFTGDALQQKDYDLAVKYLQNAQPSGSFVVLNMLGVAHRDGLGVSRDRELALGYFRDAAKKGSHKAMSNLAHLLGVDWHESPDREEALKWLYLAVELGEPTAIRTEKELGPTFPADLVAKAKAEAKQKALARRMQKIVGGEENAPSSEKPSNHE